MHHPTDRIAHTTAFVTPVVEHWLEWEIAPKQMDIVQERLQRFSGVGAVLSLLPGWKTNCQFFVWPVPNTLVLENDPLSTEWMGLDFYTLPPPVLLSRVLIKVVDICSVANWDRLFHLYALCEVSQSVNVTDLLWFVGQLKAILINCQWFSRARFGLGPRKETQPVEVVPH